MRVTLHAVAAGLLAASLPFAALADMQPGQYRTQATSDIPGDKPESQTQCITKEEIDSGLTEMGVQKSSACKVADFKKTSSSVSYRVMCNGAEAQRISGTFSNDSFDLNMEVKLDPAAKPSTIHVVGKRIGACKG